MHPRISVNSLSSLFQSFGDDLAMWRELGAERVGLISPKLEAEGWDAARRAVERSGLQVTNISTERHVLEESLRMAADLGAPAVYICSGGDPTLSWDEAAEAFGKDIAPMADLARQLGVHLGVEPTNPLRSDLSFVFCLRDALALAHQAGIEVVLDFYSCWYERGLAEMVRSDLGSIALVQVCDFKLGTFNTPNRAVVGDGDIPVEQLLQTMLEAGYQGPFDLEILGPQIDAEGYPSAIRRSTDRLGQMLDRLGA